MAKKAENIDKKDAASIKNPRNWCGKYWNNTSIKQVLQEVIKPEDIDMSSIKMNDDLNPVLWDKNDVLKEDIRQKLLKIAVEFIKFCKVDDKKFNDIVVLGSNANYNYTPYSDIDLHVVLDFSQIKAEPEIIGEFFKAKKELWGLQHDISIDDHTIECYVQNTKEPNASLGIYSLMNNEWVRKPIKKFINIDESAVQLKAADIMNRIDTLVDEFNKGVDVADKAVLIKDKIRKMRQAGLYKEGEYSPENLAFKILRNTGYLDKLSNLKNDSFDRSVSSDETKTEKQK